MSTFGCLNSVEGHIAYRTLSSGTRICWLYAEPNSRHNRSKHWVDDVNNQRHAPIDLAEAWQTKWWPNPQFTFCLSVSEINAINSRAHSKGVPAEPMLDFCRNLAGQMLENNLNELYMVPWSPVRDKMTRGTTSTMANEGARGLQHRPLKMRRWLRSTWKTAKHKYHKTPCACGKCCRT